MGRQCLFRRSNCALVPFLTLNMTEQWAYSSDGERRLVNYVSDPSEASDVLATHDTIGPSLERIQKRSPGQTPVEMDDEHREALKSLGYVD